MHWQCSYFVPEATSEYVHVQSQVLPGGRAGSTKYLTKENSNPYKQHTVKKTFIDTAGSYFHLSRCFDVKWTTALAGPASLLFFSIDKIPKTTSRKIHFFLDDGPKYKIDYSRHAINDNDDGASSRSQDGTLSSRHEGERQHLAGKQAKNGGCRTKTTSAHHRCLFSLLVRHQQTFGVLESTSATRHPDDVGLNDRCVVWFFCLSFFFPMACC